MKISFLFMGLIMGAHSAAFAKSYGENCFREHIVESIEINKSRKKDYAKLTQGESDRIFNHLISVEYISIPFAVFYDLKASKFKKKGMELFCHEFVSMNRVNEFSFENRVIPAHDFPLLDFNEYKDEIKAAVKANDHKSIKKISLKKIKELEKYPAYFCMTRHLVESIYRFAYFVDVREKEAAALNIASPKNLLIDVIGTHLLGLPDSIKIDGWSQPIQERGIPILCSELPNVIADLNVGEE